MAEKQNTTPVRKQSTVRFVALHSASRKYSVSLVRRGVAADGNVRFIPYNLTLASSAVRKFKKSINGGTLIENQLIVVTIEQGIADDHYCTFVTDFVLVPDAEEQLTDEHRDAKMVDLELVTA